MRKTIFGMHFADDMIDADDVAKCILERSAKKVELVVTANLDHIINLRRNERFAAAYRHASLVICDGFPVQLYGRLVGVCPQRITGCDVIASLMRYPAVKYHRLFFVVDSDETAAALKVWAEHQEVQIKTIIPPFRFESNEKISNAMIAEIKNWQPSIIVMGIGAPKSEIWIETHRDELPPCWVLSIGQGVKIALGLTKRAPVLMRKLGCEWLWRLGQEPTRLLRRYASDGLLFPAAIVEDLMDKYLNRVAWRKDTDR